MRVIEAPNKVGVFPTPRDLVGHHKANVEDEANGKRYAYIEQWQVPWKAPGAPMVGFGVWNTNPEGHISLSRVSDALSEVVAVVEEAGLKSR